MLIKTYIKNEWIARGNSSWLGLYEKYGLTDEVLDLQILINEFCNGNNVLSNEDLILNDEYVQ